MILASAILYKFKNVPIQKKRGLTVQTDIVPVFGSVGATGGFKRACRVGIYEAFGGQSTGGGKAIRIDLFATFCPPKQPKSKFPLEPRNPLLMFLFAWRETRYLRQQEFLILIEAQVHARTLLGTSEAPTGLNFEQNCV